MGIYIVGLHPRGEDFQRASLRNQNIQFLFTKRIFIFSLWFTEENEIYMNIAQYGLNDHIYNAC